MMLSEDYALTHERLCGMNRKCLRNSRKSVFLKISLLCYRVFWGCDFQVILRSPNSIALTEVYVDCDFQVSQCSPYNCDRSPYFNERWPRNNVKCLKTWRSQFFVSQNEIYHANRFSEVVSFRVFQCSRKRMLLIEVYVLLFKRLPRNNGKCL